MKSNNLINLESLIDLSARLIEFESIDRIINTALLSLMGKLKYTKSLVLLPDNNFFKVKKLRTEDYYHINKFQLSSITFIDSYVSNDLHNDGIDICIPVLSGNTLIAGLCFGKRLVNDNLLDEELKYAGLVASITANSVRNNSNIIEIKNKKNEAEKKNQLLRTIFEISKDFNTILTKSQILKLLSFHLMGQLTITKFSIYEIKNDELILNVNKFGFDADSELILSLKSINRTVNFNDNKAKPGIINKPDEFEYAIPMQIHGETKGLLIIGRKMNGDEISPDNILFLEALASISISALENERLFREEIGKRQLETELSFAREIQENLLPKELPEIKNYDTYGLSLPSRDVGGDYFDFISIDENRHLIAVADVSGKGMPAALIMANLQAALNVAAEDYTTLIGIVDKLNRLIYQNTTADKFVTLFIGLLNTSENTFEYINAGHNPAVYINKSGTNHLEASGLLLGFDKICDDYITEKLFLSKNDVLFIYTDGINESENIYREDFGNERLLSVLSNSLGFSARGIILNMLDSITDFTGEMNQYDDITMMVIKNIE